MWCDYSNSYLTRTKQFQAQKWFQLYGMVIWGWLISTERDSSGGTASVIWGPPGPFEYLKLKMGEQNI